MFVHTVFFKFKEDSATEEARRRLESMSGKVTSLKTIEVGVDELQTARSWDMVLITRFEDRSGYDAYAVDPIHLEVLTWLKRQVRESATVDYSV